MSKPFNGIAASQGIAIAKAFVLQNPEFNFDSNKATNIEEELERLERAFKQTVEELKVIQSHAAKNLGEDEAEIFSAHLLVVQDPELTDAIKDKITNDRLTAENAVNEVTTGFIETFENLDNEYMKERAADIRDVSKRILSHLFGVEFATPASISKESILIAVDLSPSDTAQLDRRFIKGFATDIGGRTSHSAIMARSMEIPAVVGTKDITKNVETGMVIIVDGTEGKVIIEPSSEEIAAYREKQARFEREQNQLQKLVNEASVTRDGKHLELAANIGSPADLESVLSNGADGIGLYRTEFLYMGRDRLPNEDEQYEAYKTVLEKMNGKPVVIRTLDIGGDKKLPYLELPEELNPFLGVRAIRLCLEHQDIFRTQLRALLRASTHGSLKIMFPMIATVSEFKQAKQMLLEEKEKLVNMGQQVSEDIEVGMMVEIPAAAVMAAQFAKYVDFFSIGTNDLIQYTMAADRMNEQVSYLYQPFSPAVLSLIGHVISSAHAEGKWVGMCGEMAGDQTAIPILLGLGLDEFSMSASSILPARGLLRETAQSDCEVHAKKALTMSSGEEVIAYMKGIC
ncbi:MAG TPA: phosphoenolpyruvate--protein phosphotransferase [Bacillales bacterium]|nr:phosphoenolpyruvate--protein phosphotransferase [Bacillales bacterium]